jgi:hypothetical protein
MARLASDLAATPFTQDASDDPQPLIAVPMDDASAGEIVGETSTLTRSPGTILILKRHIFPEV